MSQGYAQNPLDPAVVEFLASRDGRIRGKTAAVWHIMGRRGGAGLTDFATTSGLNDLCNFLGSGSALHPADPDGANVELISSDTNDDGSPAGTGAQVVRVAYLDSTGAFTTADFTMNGTTAVNVGTAVYKPLWMEVVTVGSNEVSVGNIDLRNVSTPTTIYERIGAGGNRSLSGRIVIPTGYSGYIYNFDVSALTADGDFRLRAKRFSHTQTLSTTYHFIDTIYAPSNTSMDSSLPYLKIPSTAAVKISVIPSSTAAGVRMDASFSMMLVQD